MWEIATIFVTYFFTSRDFLISGKEVIFFSDLYLKGNIDEEPDNQ